MTTNNHNIFRMTVGSVFKPDEQQLLVLSDVEMGAGGPEDDCPHSESIADFLIQYRKRHPRIPLNIIFNGDTFDFLKTSVDGNYPRHINERLAVLKLERISSAHPEFFTKMRRLLSEPGVEMTFVTGNHDFELVFPKVQSALKSLLGSKITFPGMTYVHGPVRIEHGSQGDMLYRIDPEHALIEHQGETILNLPWAAVGVLDVMMPYHRQFHLLDRICSKQILFEMLPEARTLFMTLAKQYMFRDYWHDLLIEGDPLKRLRWDLAKDIIGRMKSANTEVGFGAHYTDLLAKGDHEVIIVGHEHSGRIYRNPRGTLMTTGCLRSEFEIDPSSGALTPVKRSIAEVRLSGGRVINAQLLPVELPEVRPPEISSLHAPLKNALENLGQRSNGGWAWAQPEMI